jgi:hypothetical protein
MIHYGNNNISEEGNTELVDNCIGIGKEIVCTHTDL